MQGKRAFLEQLVADGVEYIFGNPGTTEQAFQDLLQEFPQITYVLCLHEGVAVSMADAFARATGRPAVVQLHIAPGLGNAMGMIYNAWAAHSPLIVYVGQSATSALIQEPLLYGDLVGMARPVTKWAVQVDHALDIPQTVRRAMSVAMQVPRGPVVIALPIDVMEEEADVEICASSLPVGRMFPDPALLDEAAEILASAKSPLVIAGDGVSLCNAQESVARLAEQLGAPIWLGYSTEVNVDPEHPLLVGSLPNTSIFAPKVAEDLLAQHDVVLVVGSPVFRFIFPKPGSPIPTGLKVVQVDLDAAEIGKNFSGVFGIHADTNLAIQGLVQRLESVNIVGAAERSLAVAEQTKRARAAKLTADDGLPLSTVGGIPVPLAMREIAAAIPPNTAIFEEAMTSAPSFNRYVKVRADNYFRARGGGIGPGIPGAVGLKLARPDQPVIGVVSDGSGMYSITALWTAAHHQVPVVWVVMNNGGYRILRDNLVEYLGPKSTERQFVELELDDPELHFDQLANVFGVHGERVTVLEEIGPAIARALALGRPAVVDVVVSKEF